LNSATSTDQTLTTTGCSTGGGGSAPSSAQPAVGQANLTLAFDHIEKQGNGLATIWLVWVRLNAQPGTVRGYALSTDPNLTGASLNNYTDLVSITVPTTSDKVTIYGRYYSTSGAPSALLSMVVDLTAGTGTLVTPPPVVTPPVVTPPPATPSGVLDPSDLQTLLLTLGLTRKISVEDLVLKQVYDDAKEFKLTLTADQAQAIRNFIIYGISPATIKFGQGERRAIERDYMETVNRPNFVWSDIERLATGQVPLTRNLTLERLQVSKILPTFRQLFGHNPNFKNATENLAWNCLLYRIRFPRDIVKETKGLQAYRALYAHNPKTNFGWAVVRVLGYVIK